MVRLSPPMEGKRDCPVSPAPGSQQRLQWLADARYPRAQSNARPSCQRVSPRRGLAWLDPIDGVLPNAPRSKTPSSSSRRMICLLIVEGFMPSDCAPLETLPVSTTKGRWPRSTNSIALPCCHGHVCVPTRAGTLGMQGPGDRRCSRRTASARYTSAKLRAREATCLDAHKRCWEATTLNLGCTAFWRAA